MGLGREQRLGSLCIVGRSRREGQPKETEHLGRITHGPSYSLSASVCHVQEESDSLKWAAKMQGRASLIDFKAPLPGLRGTGLLHERVSVEASQAWGQALRWDTPLSPNSHARPGRKDSWRRRALRGKGRSNDRNIMDDASVWYDQGFVSFFNVHVVVLACAEKWLEQSQFLLFCCSNLCLNKDTLLKLVTGSHKSTHDICCLRGGGGLLGVGWESNRSHRAFASALASRCDFAGRRATPAPCRGTRAAAALATALGVWQNPNMVVTGKDLPALFEGDIHHRWHVVLLTAPFSYRLLTRPYPRTPPFKCKTLICIRCLGGVLGGECTSRHAR